MSGVQTPTIQLAFDPADGFPADDTLTSQGGRGSTPIAARSACKRLGSRSRMRSASSWAA